MSPSKSSLPTASHQVGALDPRRLPLPLKCPELKYFLALAISIADLHWFRHTQHRFSHRKAFCRSARLLGTYVKTRAQTVRKLTLTIVGIGCQLQAALAT